MMLETEFGWNRWLALIITSVFTLLAAAFLMHLHDKRTAAASSAASETSDSYAG
jgi:H+/gluconate symporter-like permease